MPPVTLKDGTQLDPKVVKVMRAIRSVESGGDYNAVGDNGQSKGAYQFNGDNWKNWAGEYLGNKDAPMTPENQNKLMYARIEKQKNEGLSPEEIAALHNGAHKDPTTGKYTYNNPVYGEKFRAALAKEATPQQQGNFVNPGTPTPQGNNFVQPPAVQPAASQPTTDTQQQPENKPGLLSQVASGVGGFLRAAESPFLGVAAIPTQALAKALGQPDPFQKGIGGGATPGDVTPLNLEQKAGDIAQVGSYFVPGSGVLGAAGMGALQGAGAAMSRKEDLGTVAGQGVLGAGLGAGTALAAKGIGYGLNKAGEALSGEGVQKAVQGVKTAYSKALNLNAAERGFESRSGKDLAQVLLTHSAPLERNANGTLNASGAIDKLQSALNPLNKQADALVGNAMINKQVSHFVPLDQVKSKLLTTIRNSAMDSLEKENSVRSATKLMGAIKREYGDVVSPQVAEKIKQTLQGSAFKKALTTSDSLQKNVSYLASRVMKDSTEKAIGGAAGKEYAALNAQRGDLVDAITRLTKLDGSRLVKGGKLGNMAGGLTGAIIGSQSGGLLGGLAGDYFGAKAAEFLNNPATQIAIANAKAQSMGKLPALLGRASKPVGTALSKTGGAVSKSARPIGLLGNLLAK